MIWWPSTQTPPLASTTLELVRCKRSFCLREQHHGSPASQWLAKCLPSASDRNIQGEPQSSVALLLLWSPTRCSLSWPDLNFACLFGPGDDVAPRRSRRGAPSMEPAGGKLKQPPVAFLAGLLKIRISCDCVQKLQWQRPSLATSSILCSAGFRDALGRGWRHV